MKVLQLIDSLHAGGAERVAVNYANALSSRIETSYLCTTREEGLLKESVLKEVEYLFLNKRKTIDLAAIRRLSGFVKKHRIDIIHAHATSYFLATLIKILNPKLILVWHDHYGNSEFLQNRPVFVLNRCSKWFNHVFTVNLKLECWVREQLRVTAVSYLPNFARTDGNTPVTQLKGKEGKRVVCLANLREQKDHINLLKAFKIVLEEHTDWTLHLVGKDFKDACSLKVKTFITENNLAEHIFIYGSCRDVSNILNQSSIGVLSSKSEGLPVSLLEYGLAKLPVIATNVGECSQVISTPSEGVLMEANNDEALAQAMLLLIDDFDLRSAMAESLNTKVLHSFSELGVIHSLISIYDQIQK